MMMNRDYGHAATLLLLLWSWLSSTRAAKRKTTTTNHQKNDYKDNIDDNIYGYMDYRTSNTHIHTQRSNTNMIFSDEWTISSSNNIENVNWKIWK